MASNLCSSPASAQRDSIVCPGMSKYAALDRLSTVRRISAVVFRCRSASSSVGKSFPVAAGQRLSKRARSHSLLYSDSVMRQGHRERAGL